MGLALLVDTTSIFAFQRYLKKHDFCPGQASINYGALLESLHHKFPDGELDPMFAFVAIDPEHEGQQKFCGYLRNQGFIVDETDFRDAFIIPDKESPYQRLSTRIAYLAGMLTQKYDNGGQTRELPHLVVVTDAFDVYYPLLDYVQNRGGKVTLTFFRRGLEDRWQRAGLFDDDSVVQFRDLSDDAKLILGADLGSTLGQTRGRTGLGDFQL